MAAARRPHAARGRVWSEQGDGCPCPAGMRMEQVGWGGSGKASRGVSWSTRRGTESSASPPTPDESILSVRLDSRRWGRLGGGGGTHAWSRGDGQCVGEREGRGGGKPSRPPPGVVCAPPRVAAAATAGSAGRARGRPRSRTGRPRVLPRRRRARLHSAGARAVEAAPCRGWRRPRRPARPPRSALPPPRAPSKTAARGGTAGAARRRSRTGGRREGGGAGRASAPAAARHGGAAPPCRACAIPRRRRRRAADGAAGWLHPAEPAGVVPRRAQGGPAACKERQRSRLAEPPRSGRPPRGGTPPPPSHTPAATLTAARRLAGDRGTRCCVMHGQAACPTALRGGVARLCGGGAGGWQAPTLAAFGWIGVSSPLARSAAGGQPPTAPKTTNHPVYSIVQALETSTDRPSLRFLQLHEDLDGI